MFVTGRVARSVVTLSGLPQSGRPVLSGGKKPATACRKMCAKCKVGGRCLFSPESSRKEPEIMWGDLAPDGAFF